MLKLLLLLVYTFVAAKSDLIEETLEVGNWIMAAEPVGFNSGYILCSWEYKITRKDNQTCTCGDREAPLLEVQGPGTEGQVPFIVTTSVEELRAATHLQCTCPVNNHHAKVLLKEIEPGYVIVIFCDSEMAFKCKPTLFVKTPPPISKLQEITPKLHAIYGSWSVTCAKYD